jgi:hypothetical protein
MNYQSAGGKKKMMGPSRFLLGLTLSCCCLPHLAFAQIAGEKTAETGTDTGPPPATVEQLHLDIPGVKPPSYMVTVNGEVENLKRELAEQKKQIEELRQLLLSQKQQTDSAKQPASATQATPARTSPKQGEVAGTDLIASAVPMVPSSAGTASAAMTPSTAALPQAGAAGDQASPLQFKLGEAYITPVGFMDLTNTYRSTNAGTSLQTNFGSIPYNNVVAGRLSEDKFSAANSRLGLRVDALVKGTKILGYYEGDFVGGVAGNNTQVSSNSLLYRIRLYWVDARKGDLEMLAGQSWSMMTPNRKQISALPADLFYSQVVDVNYMNGLTWGRIPGIRFLYHPSEKVTMGISLENSSQYFGGSGGGGVSTLPAALPTLLATELDANVVNGVTVPNVHPDIIGKIAFDLSPRVHFEFAAVEDTVKLFNPTTKQYFTQAGVGGSANLNLELFKGFRFVTNNFWSDGAGRYLFGVAPNFIVRADGSPSLIHAGSTVSGFEFQRKNTQLYTYYGGIYIGRNTAIDADGKSLIGYGYSGSPAFQNRTTQEGTIGLTQTVWRDGKFGALQVMLQYAYFFRNPWALATGAPKSAHENVVWFNLRYVLPGSAPTIKY